MKMKNKGFRIGRKIILITGFSVIGCVIIVCVIIVSGSRQRKLNSLLDTGDRCLTDSDYEQAATAYLAATQIDPKCEAAYLGPEEAYTAMSNSDKAPESEPDSAASAENLTDQWTDSSDDLEKVSRINYYDSDGTLIYFDSYAYYDNGLLCSTTLYSIDYSLGLEYALTGNRYTFLYLYDQNGNLTQRVLDALTISAWYDEDTGEIILNYEYDSDGNSRKISIFPEKESIEQEKFGVDSSKTEKIYGDAPIISTDSGNGWASTYLRDVLDGEDPTDQTTCQLIYIDDNMQPELWIDYGYGYAGAEIYTADNGMTDSISTSHGVAYWLENRNLLLTRGGRMDIYDDRIYQIQDGKFVTIATGDYGAPDNSNLQFDENHSVIYDYYWNDVKVSKEEYEQCLYGTFDKNSAVEAYQNIYTYDQCKLLLRAIADSSVQASADGQTGSSN